jgi:uncharacterized protein YfaS (alpha-2-macroglobulin family)
MIIPGPHQKLHDYKSQLAFVQDELRSDRTALALAKASGASPEDIEKRERDITNLELGIDQIQNKILHLKLQLA